MQLTTVNPADLLSAHAESSLNCRKSGCARTVRYSTVNVPFLLLIMLESDDPRREAELDGD